LIDDAVILVTGGAGSLGQASIHYLLEYQKPRKVIVYSRDEEKHRLMRLAFDDDRLRFRIGDVRDQDRLDDVMRPVDIVIHAAALKQIEACDNDPDEAQKTNIEGSRAVAISARRHGVSKAIFISSDKAVAPLNVYGTSKAAAEQAWLRSNVHKPIYSCTRWGNIEGSRGSVIPVFKDLIAKGKPMLPVTDERMTRFTVTFEQAIATILQAIEGPPGLIVFPKSPSYRIIDLVAAFGRDYYITGIRPAEKLHETLMLEEEARHARHYEDCVTILPERPFNTDIDYCRDEPFGKWIGAQPIKAYSSNDNGFLTVEQLKERIR
jgi:UDP-N-acetylglucosamine 4,6-dehydratase